MSKESKTIKLENKPKLRDRAKKGFTYKVLPIIAKAVVVSGFVYGAVMVVINYSPLPDSTDSGLAVVLTAVVLKLATLKKK